jgi:phosphopantetheine--protein transferase-like protein
MIEADKLRSIVGELMQVPADQIVESTVFAGTTLASSMGRARLDAALRSRLNFASTGVYTVPTFGGLCKLAGAEVPDGSVSHSPQMGPSRGTVLGDSTGQNLAVGVDVQSVSELPEAQDYWESEFYQQHFTGQEIAYALLQPNPRESFASAWCAKEALRKADSRWLDVSWKLTEVTHTPEGAPALMSEKNPIPSSVSLSHTKDHALAVVVLERGRPVPPQSLPVVSPSLETQAISSPDTNKLPLSLAVIAVLISLVAIGLVLLK